MYSATGKHEAVTNVENVQGNLARAIRNELNELLRQGIKIESIEIDREAFARNSIKVIIKEAQ